METKKSSRANLEKDLSLNFMMGIVVSLAILFVGFEWGEKDFEVAFYPGPNRGLIDDDIAPSVQDVPPPPLPEPELPKELDVINIVEDAIEVEATIDFSSEDDPSQAVSPPARPTGIVEDEEKMNDDKVFFIVEKQPEFPGGEPALLKYIADNIIYPAIAIDNGFSGRVFCEFVVNADGSVSDVAIVRPLNQYLDKEALRVLKTLPRFKPGEQRGKPVRVKYSISVQFKLAQN